MWVQSHGDSFDAKEISVINLTEVFGRGNEPSKAWCDENLSNYSDSIQIPFDYQYSASKKIVSAYIGINGVAKKIFGRSSNSFTENIIPTQWDVIYGNLATTKNKHGKWTIYGNIRDLALTSDYNIDKGFNGNTSDYTITQSTSSGTIDNVYILLPKGVEINPSKLTIVYGYCSDMTVYGYNVSTNSWESICTGGGQSGKKTHDHSYSNDKYYSKFRIDISGRSSTVQARIYSFEITSGKIKY